MAESRVRPGQILAIIAVVVTGLAAGCGGDGTNRDATVEVDTIGGVVVVRNGIGLWGESERWRVVEEFRVGGSQWGENPDEELIYSADASATLAVRGQSRPSTESGEAPGWQGATKGE